MAATTNKSERNGMHIQLSLFFHFYVLYLLLNSCDGNDAFWRHSMLVKSPSARVHLTLSLQLCVSAKQSWFGPGCLQNLETAAGMCVQDTCPRHQRLEAAPLDTWASISQNVIDEAVGRWRKRLRASIGARPSVKRKPTLFRATNSQSS